MVAKQVIAAVLLAMFAGQASADCRSFFYKRQAVVVQQVVAPYYAPLQYYAAGSDLQAEALAERVARLVEKKLAIRQEQVAPPAPGVFAKCIRCHSGPEAAGGLVLDGRTPIDCYAYFRWGKIAGQGRDVPAKMQALVSGMTPEQKGAINDAMLDLVAQPIADKPPPPVPVPDGELQ